MAELDCAACEDHVCREGADCYDSAERIEALCDKADEATRRLVEVASLVESKGYMRWPRALEIIRFAEAANFSHLGVAFCIGLRKEARVYVELLQERFTVSSVCCKVCGLSKQRHELELLRDDVEDEVMCCPQGQASLLNEAGTELNVAMGLCVGHDALFAKCSTAPVTTLVAKDRVLAHNPLGALYSDYWLKRLRQELGS